jgi:hypothetical protein
MQRMLRHRRPFIDTSAWAGPSRLKRLALIAVAMEAICVSHLSSAVTIRVPGDQHTIQAGVAAASVGDTVLVAPGVYAGAHNRNIDFNGVDLVLRSEMGPEVTILDCEYMATAFWFRHGESEAAVVEGFTIRRGGWWDGGGMNLDGSSPTVRQCLFVDCLAEGAGGAFIAHGGAPRFIECQFIGGTAFFGGGGACLWSSPHFYRCSFVGNLTQNGAAFAGAGESAVFESCTFASNVCDPGGEVIELGNDSSLIMRNCTMVGSNCPAISVLSGTVELSQTTMAFGEEPPILCLPPTTIELSCCDIFGNTGGDWIGCIADQYGINGNISEDPLFCDATTGDFTLDAASPCAPENSGGCGLIGAWPVGCYVTSVGSETSQAYRPRLSIHPNPVVFCAQFSIEGDTRGATIEILDAQGRIVDLIPISGSTAWKPKESTPSGVYFAKLRTRGDSEVVKLLLIR